MTFLHFMIKIRFVDLFLSRISMNTNWHSYDAQLNASFHNRFGNRLIKKQNKGRRVDKAFNFSNKISQNLIYLGEILIVGIFSFSTLIFGSGNLTPNNSTLVYPLQEVSKLECRTQEWALLSGECKKTLPIIKGAAYDQYQNNT